MATAGLGRDAAAWLLPGCLGDGERRRPKSIPASRDEDALDRLWRTLARALRRPRTACSGWCRAGLSVRPTWAARGHGGVLSPGGPGRPYGRVGPWPAGMTWFVHWRKIGGPVDDANPPGRPGRRSPASTRRHAHGDLGRASVVVDGDGRAWLVDSTTPPGRARAPAPGRPGRAAGQPAAGSGPTAPGGRRRDGGARALAAALAATDPGRPHPNDPRGAGDAPDSLGRAGPPGRPGGGARGGP